MNLRTYGLSSLLLLTGALASEPSLAACSMALAVKSIDARKTMIATFNESGKFLKQEARELAVHQPVLDCNESLGLVKIKLKDEREVWINRSDVIRVSGKSPDPDVCVPVPVSASSDRAKPYDSGADPARVPCKDKV